MWICGQQQFISRCHRQDTANTTQTDVALSWLDSDTLVLIVSSLLTDGAIIVTHDITQTLTDDEFNFEFKVGYFTFCHNHNNIHCRILMLAVPTYSPSKQTLLNGPSQTQTKRSRKLILKVFNQLMLMMNNPPTLLKKSVP